MKKLTTDDKEVIEQAITLAQEAEKKLNEIVRGDREVSVPKLLTWAYDILTAERILVRLHRESGLKRSEEKPKFTNETEISIMASILGDPKFQERILSYWEPEYFTNVILQDMFKLAKGFKSRYKKPITEDEFMEEFECFLRDKTNIKATGERRNLKADREHYIRIAEKVLIKAREGDHEYAEDKATEFAEYQAIKNAVVSIIDRLQKGSYSHEDVLEIIKGARVKTGELEVTSLKEVEPEEIEWLWDGKIPMGKLTLLVGDPGGGKSMLSIYLASKISKGHPWHDNPEIENPKGSVILLACEDGLADTIRVRAETEGADLSKIHVIEGKVEKGELRQFNLDSDIPKLEEAIDRIKDVRLVVIDPLFAYTPKGDYYKDPEMRSRYLAPLARLAERTNVAIIAIMHMNKDQAKKALYRVGGSVAFSGSARTVWFVVKDEKDELGNRRLFLCEKMSIGPRPDGMAFRIKQLSKYKPKIEFEGEPLLGIDVEDVLKEKKDRPIDEAIRFLKEVLKDEEKPASEIIEEAESEGITETTLKRAKKKLMIDSKLIYEEGEKVWLWHLPKHK